MLIDELTSSFRPVDLAQPLHPAIPTSPNHPGYRHSLLRRHGDTVREDGSSGANDLLVLGSHTGTHIDALSHISHRGQLHGGADAAEAARGGRFSVHGVETIAPMLRRAVLLDLPALHGVTRLDAGYGISPDELAAATELAGTRLRSGDIALVRTGWSQLWEQPSAFLGTDTGVPGPTADAARWLAEQQVAVTGSDTTAYEHIRPGTGHARLPAHVVLLVDNGIPIIEMLQLERLAATGHRVAAMVLAPLPLVGATGSPVRPVALVPA
ncbi:cyclase family protein [Amycolatopsis jiangsuensis]|uniref:Kynurenine formamidase n=1 Tax=Amycolatopsis jiangsuensis TaxID=1181879 RepID=A0A840J489_9PSEU|nr:cyclase family protein [Amycolatopsis jiangsuensis]MBB4688218.1 kynurenine formamidase [Amycolatopsis jiangsuensis]